MAAVTSVATDLLPHEDFVLPQIASTEAKLETLLHVLTFIKKRIVQRLPTPEARRAFTVLIWCNTKISLEAVVAHLAQNKWAAAELHGDLSQQEKWWALHHFRSGERPLLVCTDAVLQIATEKLPLTGAVVVYDAPASIDALMTRIGVERSGPSFTLLFVWDKIAAAVAAKPKTFVRLDGLFDDEEKKRIGG